MTETPLNFVTSALLEYACIKLSTVPFNTDEYFLQILAFYKAIDMLSLFNE